MAAVVEEPSDEQRLRSRLGMVLGRRIAGKDLLRPFKQRPVDQC
jgi:hypothetical protein